MYCYVFDYVMLCILCVRITNSVKLSQNSFASQTTMRACYLNECSPTTTLV